MWSVVVWCLIAPKRHREWHNDIRTPVRIILLEDRISGWSGCLNMRSWCLIAPKHKAFMPYTMPVLQNTVYWETEYLHRWHKWFCCWRAHYTELTWDGQQKPFQAVLRHTDECQQSCSWITHWGQNCACCGQHVPPLERTYQPSLRVCGLVSCHWKQSSHAPYVNIAFFFGFCAK